MKVLILTLLLLFSSTVLAQVSPQTIISNNGQTLFRVVNNTPYFVNCFYRDSYNYFTFSIAPRSYSMWYPVYGAYQWQCN